MQLKITIKKKTSFFKFKYEIGVVSPINSKILINKFVEANKSSLLLKSTNSVEITFITSAIDINTIEGIQYNLGERDHHINIGQNRPKKWSDPVNDFIKLNTEKLPEGTLQKDFNSNSANYSYD
ncbi:hypothetical protein CG007_00125 [Mesoplasma entomophilum]|uniref:hypothetical protein n=1 Tax=Mesoplasma entomophilum TaxID=2149 RepID=UPI000D02BC87|nr:hypothetical protein [Mesoplasma entomophilum]AVN60040.1 hypothetical protein CG007_00125 [Mesoplasma entomophilum]